MAVQTGRTNKKFCDFQMGDSAGTMRSIPVDTINGLALTYDEQDLTAFIDAIHGVLTGWPNMTLTIAGPWDTTAAAAAGSLSGSHTVLNVTNGLAVGLSLNIEVGMRHAWVSGEPTFGITHTTTAGVIVTDYGVDINNGKFTAKIRHLTGSTACAWATVAYT